MPLQYTIDEAKDQLKRQGIEWTPDVEKNLREAGRIKEVAPASASMPWLKELGLGIADMGFKAQQVMSPAMLNPAEALLRAQTGTTPAEQMTAGTLGGISAGNINREMLDVPEPTSNVQRGFDLTGQGLGMSTAFIPIGGATNLAVRGISNPLARRVAGGALGFAGYNAFQPAENVGEWAQNVGEGALTGGIVGMIPKPMGAGVANTIGRGAVDLGTFGTMGAVDRIRSDPNLGAGDFLSVLPQSLAEAVPQMAGMGVVHGMTNRTPERLAQTPAELERLLLERAQTEDLARVAEETRLANEAALAEQAKKAEMAIAAERVARQRAEAEAAKAQAEAARQAEVDARLGNIRAAREARGAIPVETPLDPMAGPVAPTAGVEQPAPLRDNPPFEYRQEPGTEQPMANLNTDPVAQNQRTMDRIRAMQAMRDARLQQPQEPVQAPTEAQPQVAEQPVQPELPLAVSAPEPIVSEQTPTVRRSLPERKTAPSRLAKLTKAEIDADRVRDEIDRGSRDLAVAMGREPATEPAQVAPVAAPERTPGQSLVDRFNNRKPISQALEEIKAQEAQRNAEREQRLADERAKIEERQRERDRQMQAEREASSEGAKERKFRNDPAKMKELARLQAEEQSISDEITKMTDRLDGGEPITQELIDQNSALLARYEAASKAVDEYLSTRGGETPAKPRGDVTLGSGPAQAMWEQASKILSGARQKRQVAQAGKPKGEFELAKEELAKPVEEHPDSVPFTEANQGRKSFRDAVMDVANRHRTLAATPDISAYPEKANDAQKADVDARNLKALRGRIGNAVADRIDQGFTKKLRGKHVGFTDPVRKMQESSDGELVSAIEASEIHGGREIEMAARKHADEIGSEYADLKKNTGVTDKRQLEIAGRLLDRYVSNGRTRRANDAEFIRDPENLKLLVESGTPGMLDYVKGVRDIMDRMREVAHEANLAMGGEGIGDLEAYFPKVAGKPKFFDLNEKRLRSAAKEGRDPRSLATATETFNPRAERRSSTDPEMVDLNGREVPREWNAETVLEGYVDTMLRSTTGDIALGQSRDIAKYMDIKANAAERAGDKETAKQLRIRANVVRNLASQKWAHNLFGAGAVADALPGAFGAPGSVAKDLIAANKRAFDNAKYRLNPRFNLVTQWTSIINPVMSDPVAGLMALRDMGVPFSKNAAKDFAGSTYEARRKSMPHSQMRAQIEGAGNIAQIGDIPNTPKKIANTFMDGLTQAIENSANKYSALVAYHATRNMKGLTPRQRALAAGQGVFKTQSAFTFGERPGILNSRVVQGTFPAQGYAIELANQIREALGHTGVDTRLYGESKGQQYAHAGGIIGAAIMQNVWQNLVFNAMRGKDPEESLNFDSIWDATVALPPFISALLPTGRGGSDMPQPPLPVAQTANVINKGKRAAVGIADGDLAPTKKLMEYVASQWVTGGTFASDISSGKYTNIIDTVSGGGGEAVPGPVTPVRPAKITTTRGRIAPVRVAPKKSGGLR